MNKDQLLHLHGLLAHVREDVQDRADIETPSYDDTQAGPMSLHLSKNKHKEAVFALAEDLGPMLEDLEPQSEISQTEQVA